MMHWQFVVGVWLARVRLAWIQLARGCLTWIWLGRVCLAWIWCAWVLLREALILEPWAGAAGERYAGASSRISVGAGGLRVARLEVLLLFHRGGVGEGFELGRARGWRREWLTGNPNARGRI